MALETTDDFGGLDPVATPINSAQLRMGEVHRHLVEIGCIDWKDILPTETVFKQLVELARDPRGDAYEVFERLQRKFQDETLALQQRVRRHTGFIDAPTDVRVAILKEMAETKQYFDQCGPGIRRLAAVMGPTERARGSIERLGVL